MEETLLGQRVWTFPIADGKALLDFIKGREKHLQISLEEAMTALRYVEGHGYEIGHKEEEILCCDHGKGEVYEWEPYSIDDLINDAYDFNDAMIRQTIEGLHQAEDDQTYEELNVRLEQLRKDEEILDKAYDRTKYGIQLERLAKQLAEQCILVVKRGRCLEEIDRELGKILGEEVKTSLYAAIKEDKGKTR